MVQYGRWSMLLTIVLSVLGFVYAAPNLIFDQEPRGWPSWSPHKKMNLGLDLQGGAHLLLEVQTSAVIKELLDAILSDARRELRRERVNYDKLAVEGNAVVVELREVAQSALAQELLGKLNTDFVLATDGPRLRLTINDAALARRQQSIIDQSIEVVRRRVDETGVAEPTIQQQGKDRIVVELPGVGDPDRVKRLLGQTAKLNFHMVDEVTPIADALNGLVPPGSMLLYETDRGRQQPILVRREIEVSGDRLVDAQPTFQDAQPIVSFRFDTQGGRKFGDTTTRNVNKRLAIVLDDKVISAPVIRSPIIGGSGIITGGFTVQEANDLALLLRAGALPAPLVVLEERTVGPGLGADSIAAGKLAAIIGMVLVAGFMSVYYSFFGVLAIIALSINIAMIVALLSLLGASLTLPGIAGIVLTMGMAVDSNVLIYERVREELRAGRSPISAIEQGFTRAMAAIVDSNVTMLIAGLLLFSFGAGPIRGFAVTLSIGIITSQFTSVQVTRLLVVLWLRRRRPKLIPI